MKQLLLLVASCLLCLMATAQSNLTIQIKDSKTQAPLPGATVSVRALNTIRITDQNGQISLTNVPTGNYMLNVTHIGYTSKADTLSVPFQGIHEIMLEPAAGEELDEVVVTTTRSSRTISTIPTRIEVIAGEELDEKSNMKPGDIRMVLNESTGIQTQQTSATSANASIRIQGLDGRYTQILKDGFPVFSGAASGLGLLQTPPLDLKQVEVIKGSASTLYGGGAIAGLVNLVSKVPTDERELNFMLNATTAGGLDLNGFFGEKFGKTGLTVFASRNSNTAFAPGSVDFTAIPKFERYTLNPKLHFWIGDKTTLIAGLNTSIENRTGGDLHFIEGNVAADHSYFEQNDTRRVSSQLSFEHRFSKNRQLSIRNSVSYFNRQIAVPGYNFKGTQYGTFSEASYTVEHKNVEWITGLNLQTDQFKEQLKTAVALRNYNQTTVGGFVQQSLHATKWLELETGLRGDYVFDYGFSLLPRISALFRISPRFSSRLGGGLGYKTPTIFTEESERIQYQGVLPISAAANKLEKSYGANWDLNYRKALAENLSFTINHLFFYTRLTRPLSLQQTGTLLQFENINGHFDTRGMETNLKISYNDFKLFLGYTLTDARIHVGTTDNPNPLTAKHRLNHVLMYEAEDKWKLGLEAYYYSKQLLTDGKTGRHYWTTGFMAEKLWERFSVFINFENFTDTRQTRFDTIYTGSSSSPAFRDIYAPLDGFVANGGIKLKL